jgi:uncharacterized protein
MQLFRILGWVSMATFGLVALMRWRRARIDPRVPLGLILDCKTVTDFGAGSLIGALAILGVFAVEQFSGLLQTTATVPSDIPITDITRFGLSYLVSVFIEELLASGLMLSGLVFHVRQRWIAIGLMAAIFGSLHAMNAHANLLSVFSNALGGAVYGMAYLGSNRLWLGFGMHFTWNFVQGPILGFPVSGGTMPRSMFSQYVSGPSWLTGGMYGPEGGLIAIGFRFLAASLVVVWLIYSKRLADRFGGSLVKLPSKP